MILKMGFKDKLKQKIQDKFTTIKTKIEGEINVELLPEARKILDYYESKVRDPSWFSNRAKYLSVYAKNLINNTMHPSDLIMFLQNYIPSSVQAEMGIFQKDPSISSLVEEALASLPVPDEKIKVFCEGKILAPNERLLGIVKNTNWTLMTKENRARDWKMWNIRGDTLVSNERLMTIGAVQQKIYLTNYKKELINNKFENQHCVEGGLRGILTGQGSFFYYPISSIRETKYGKGLVLKYPEIKYYMSTGGKTIKYPRIASDEEGEIIIRHRNLGQLALLNWAIQNIGTSTTSWPAGIYVDSSWEAISEKRKSDVGYKVLGSVLYRVMKEALK
ncbi:MAG: hypothetical protein ACTSU5_17815 [Promethearchaeota archaeon]